MTNLHYLELFYQVARHEGISRAARNMDYGIQQPAISKQMLQLERDFGVRLFERQPFHLTAPGEILFAKIRPFFEQLPTLRDSVRGDRAPTLRLGASEFVLREYVPEAMARMEQREPTVRFDLHTGSPTQLCAWLEAGEIDLGIAALDRAPACLEWLRVVRLPLVLLAPRRLRITAPDRLWANGPGAQRLVCPAPTDGVGRIFQEGLRRRGITWTPAIAAGSTASVTSYVAQGQGIGVSLDLPTLVRDPKVRVLPLPGFAPAEIAVLWRAPARPLLQSMLEVIGQRARDLWPLESSR